MASAGRWFLHEQISDDFASNWLRATDGGPTGDMAICRRLRDPEFEDWFRDEIALRKKLVATPGLARLIDDGEHEGVPWLVQEWVEGMTLHGVLLRCHQRRVPIPMEMSVFIMGQVLRHLDALHHALDEKGPLAPVHRDVCPGTIHLGFDGLVRLPTLLSAKSRITRAKTALGTIVGRFWSCSPEQAHGDRLDHYSDQFSAGIALYELVCGLRPYRADSDQQIHMQARAGNFIAPRKHNKHIPEELEEAILQAMHREPAQRFDSCGQLAEELSEIEALFDDRATAMTLSVFLQRLEGAMAS